MERPNLSVIGKIIKEKWNCADFMSTSNHHDHPCEFPWALKIYACSFCKRRFKSAQALGGHMNVHRRERARLRLFPTLTVADQLHNNPSSRNPNPKSSSASPSSSTLSVKFLPYHNYITPRSVLSPDHPLTSSSLPDHDPLASTEKDMKMTFNFPRSRTSTIPLGASSQGSHGTDTTTKSMKEVPVLDDGDLDGFSRKAECFKAFKTEKIIQTLDLETLLLKDHKEDVDLELRLGYS